MNATQDSLIRSDRRGRLRYAPEQKAALLDAYDASGLSGPKFAALHGVNYQTLAAWLQKRKRAGTVPGLPAPAGWSLLEVESTASCAGDGITVRLPGGAEVRVTCATGVALGKRSTRPLYLSASGSWYSRGPWKLPPTR